MPQNSRVSFASTATGGRSRSGGAPPVETSTNRRRIQDVLGQARAALRQSQQFRHIPESKDANLGSKLQFQQQPQEDYWSSPGAGGVVSAAENERNLRSAVSMDREDEDRRSRASYDLQRPSHLPHKTKQDDFGMPFRDAMKKSSGIAPPQPKTPLQHQRKQLSGISSADQINSDASTTSISMSTNDLRVSDDYSSSEEDSQEVNSQGSVAKKSIKSATTRSTKREMKLKEWEVPSTVKLTPLNSAVTSVPVEAFGEPAGEPETKVEGTSVRGGASIVDDENNVVPLPRPPMASATGKVEKDDMGFSRAHIMKTDEDPHWFEKALLARGETISEAAYKAFKQTQSVQLQQEREETENKSMAKAVKKTRGKPIFSNLTDPEYTADWISDGGLTSSLISEVDMPISDYLKDEVLDISKATGEVDLDSVAVEEDEINTESMIKTATELEQSGVLDEISENLLSVLDISDHPESQNFSGMSPEEKTFAKEYDEAMEDSNEPLQSIFVDEVQEGSSKRSRKISQSFSGSAGRSENTSGSKRHVISSGNEEEEEDDYDDNTFIQVDSTVSSFTKSKSLSKRRSSKSVHQSSSTVMSASTRKDKKSKSTSSPAVNTSSAGVRSSKSVKVKETTGSGGTGSRGSASDKSKSKLLGKSKSYASTSSTTSKRLNSLPIPPDPPTSRHQKNIQNLLEKEVYQKEVKRIRSEKIREEKNQEKLQKIAKESLERNKKGTWKDPDYTEILLPELFKYKSLSGLQAAKAKKSISMNYGAPYFQMNGAISGVDGTESMLAAARVESLDIPDLVREVLASNERMYRMTVEASEQMVKKAYKDKMRKDLNRNLKKKI